MKKSQSKKEKKLKEAGNSRGILAESSLTNKKKVDKNLESFEEREKKELELNKIKDKTEELENTRKALLNILEDTEESREEAESERDKTESIITNFVDGLLVFDQDGALSLVNPRAEYFFNIKAEEITGLTVSEFSNVTQLKPLAKLLGQEIKLFSKQELPLRENLILEISSVILSEEKDHLGALIILHDVTREKNIERMKSEFISISAHQLRTPLSAIKWTIQMIMSGDMGKISSEAREYLEKTYQSNERMINLVNDLLNISRIEEGRFLYNVELVSIKDLVKEIIDASAVLAAKRKIKITFNQLLDKSPKIKVDFKKVRLAIQNLVDNAIKYSIPGNEVVISLQQKKENNNNFVLIKVKDNGIGINKKEQKRLFSKFFRGENALRLQTEGSGLGLFIVKNIIKEHKGKIWFESAENKGSTFYVQLPLTS